MKRNLIPDLQKVDWSDTSRQSEYVNSVVSALNGLGEKLDLFESVGIPMRVCNRRKGGQ